MAKNKGTHGRGKESNTALEPDEFVQTVSSFADTIQPHLKKIAFGVGIAVAAICVWKFMEWRSGEASKKTTTAFMEAVVIDTAPIVGPDDEDPNKDSLIPILTFADQATKSAAYIAALSVVKTDHSSGLISALASNKQAKTWLQEGEYDKALAAFQAFAKSDAPEMLRMVALEGVGYSFEAKAMNSKDKATKQAGLESALQAFKNLQPSEGGLLRDYALYHQARIMVALEKKEEAISLFKQVLSEQPDSSLASFVEEHLNTLQAN